MMRIACVVGARPQFVKAAVVSAEIDTRAGMSEFLIDTGQHYDDTLAGVFWRDLEMKAPEYSLGAGSGTHGEQTARILVEVERVLVRDQPDWVLVYGDTNSTLAAALAAAKLHLPVAHVEAGMRSYNRYMPEEINRVTTDHLATLHLAPSLTAVENLAAEGIVGDSVVRVGDPMLDAVLRYGDVAESRSSMLHDLPIERDSYILVTAHRAENTDDPSRLEAIWSAVSTLASSSPVVWPMHPRTRAALNELGLIEGAVDGLIVIQPVGYFDMLVLQRNARLIVTDSGGLQKEAMFHETLCITLRSETEWPETVSSGWNLLVPPSSASHIVSAVEASLEKGKPGTTLSPYGDGTAAVSIADALERGAA